MNEIGKWGPSLNKMDTIGLIAAMSQESAALLRRVKPWKKISAPHWRFFSFLISGQACVLITSGMGARRAGEATRYLVERVSPRLLISFGIAGAFGSDLEIGDVILPEAVCQLDQGKLGPLLPLEPWNDADREAASLALDRRGRNVYTGTAITTGGSQGIENQPRAILHSVLEMETAGIARVATDMGIPLRALRAISDGPRAPLPFDLGEMMDEDANLQVGKLFKMVVGNPMIVFQSRRFLRNTGIAADNAAIALIAALSHALY